MLNGEHVVYVDADAVPKGVLQTILRRAKEYGFKAVTVSSFNHEIQSENHIRVGAESQATDMKIVSLVQRGNVVVTQDYGLAALVLGKGAFALHPGGMEYTEENIDRLLFERALHAAQRRAGGRNKGPKARTLKDDERFDTAFRCLLEKALRAQP